MVAFDDPRTIQDTSLVHALFVAHPKASEARDRLFELFLIEYLLEKDTLNSPADFADWAALKHYPLPTPAHVDHLLKTSPSFEPVDGHFRLSDSTRKDVKDARAEYQSARDRCTETVSEELIATTGRKDAAKGLPIHEILEEYLSGMFAEVRMMANYFRSTLQLFDSLPDHFERFDYLLKRRLDESRLSYFAEWRRGFIMGLKRAATQGNLFIAAVFHNVLATYYLNRSALASPYQVDRLREREIYLDTNVLYSLLVDASPFHEETVYFIDRLSKLGVRAWVLPISVWEYEEALEFVERSYDTGGAAGPLIRRNPWLYQQFMTHRNLYLNSMAVCRQRHSIAKDVQVVRENYAEIGARLDARGLRLDAVANELSQEEADGMWDEHLNWMTSNDWDLATYWRFIYRDFPDSVRRHDMTCIAALASKASAKAGDALGPKVLFLTVDRKLWRLRKRYPFICSTTQFLEFILPYLFLSDIPLKDPTDFPNRLLSSQLGTLLVKRPPELTEIVRAFFREPALAEEDPRKVVAGLSEDMARALSNQRFRQLVRDSAELTREQREKLAEETAPMLEEIEGLKQSVETHAEQEKESKKRLEDLKAKVNRLQRTLAYWRDQARRR